MKYTINDWRMLRCTQIQRDKQEATAKAVSDIAQSVRRAKILGLSWDITKAYSVYSDIEAQRGAGSKDSS